MVMTIVLIRGWSFGFNKQEQQSNHDKILNQLREIKHIHFIAWDGDPLSNDSFSFQIKRLMDTLPHLKFVAFKNALRKEKLLDTYKKTNAWNVEETGFVNEDNCDFVNIDDFEKTFQIDKLLTTVLIPDEEITHYSDIGLRGLRKLKENNVQECKMILLGGGECVKKEQAVIKKNQAHYPTISSIYIDTYRINKNTIEKSVYD